MSRADERAEKRRKVSGKEERGGTTDGGRAQLGADGDFAGKE